MDWVLAILLFLHIGGAIVAFGPTFTFATLGSMAGKEPQHTNFALRFQEKVVTRFVEPLAILQGITGLLIVWKVQIDILTTYWLLLAIVLYLIALGISFGVALPTIKKLIEATNAPPPPRPEGAPAPSGPPPHIAALVRRAQMAGMAMGILLVVIVFLMVTKPF